MSKSVQIKDRLKDCQKEQLHLISHIQPHGVLLSISPEDQTVLQASANASSLFSHLDNLPGSHCKEVLPVKTLNELSKLISRQLEDNSIPTSHFRDVSRSGICFDASLHIHQGTIILELEPLESESDESADDEIMRLIDELISMYSTSSIGSLLDNLVRQIYEITCFDSVLAYQFDDQWNGYVVSQVRKPHMQCYLGQKFPASDIPKQARELYCKNLLRINSDVNATLVSLIPEINPLTAKKLDLTYSILRSMSPVHLEYLRNMGVSSSMSVSLVVGGELWALIVCHHKEPKHVDSLSRRKCLLISNISSLTIGQLIQSDEMADELSLRKKLDSILETLVDSLKVYTSINSQLPQFLDLFDSHGVCLIKDNKIAGSKGEVPEENQILTMVQRLVSEQVEDIFASDSYGAQFPEGKEFEAVASGVLAIKLSHEKENWIIWFRQERASEVSWAGNPNEPLELGADEQYLHPRKSFDLWTEVVRGKSRIWTKNQLKIAWILRQKLIEIIFKVLADKITQERGLKNLREDILAILSDEFKTPLIGVGLILEHAKDGKSLDSTRDVLAKANKRLLARLNLLSQILTLESSSEDIEVETFDLKDSTQLIIDSVINDRGLAAESIVLSAESQQITTNRYALSEILRNLIDNATVHGIGSGIVNVIIEKVKGDNLRISVVDSGAGMTEIEIENAFDRFWTGREEKKNHTSVGLGLYLSKVLSNTISADLYCRKNAESGMTFALDISTDFKGIEL